MKVLATLLDFIFPPRAPERLVRALDAAQVSLLVSPELVGSTRPAATALLPFRDERVRALIHEAKYHGNERAQRILGEVLADYLVELETDAFGRAVLVPLPLSKKRLGERGFNQCERIASFGRVPIDTALLIRTKDTEHQVGLTKKERRANVSGAFSVAAPLDPSLTYILFDDVVTTGATMQAGIDALRTGGARHILPLALAVAD